jgi:hypothetical protein
MGVINQLGKIGPTTYGQLKSLLQRIFQESTGTEMGTVNQRGLFRVESKYGTASETMMDHNEDGIFGTGLRKAYVVGSA